MNTLNNFGRKLRLLRAENDLTQEQLCDELELKGNELFNKSTISRWESGSRKPKMEIVKDLEEILGVNRGDLLRLAGYLVETSPSQVDPSLVRQRAEHFTDLANIAKSLLSNGLDSVSSPSWTTNKPRKAVYLVPNRNAASGYDELTKEQLSERLNQNIGAILQYKDWFFRTCFIPHLRSELPEELKTEPFFVVAERQPYQLIKTVRVLAARRAFKGTCTVCEPWR